MRISDWSSDVCSSDLSRALIEACTAPPDSVVLLHCPPAFELKPVEQREAYVQAWLEQNVDPLLAKLDPNLRHVCGPDFARKGDVSCYVPLAIERDLNRSDERRVGQKSVRTCR